jgi:hypothetical protein
MTEGSSKGLTWGTLLAGVLSAVALAAIGCVKPMAGHDGASPLGVNLPGASEPGNAQQRYISRETSPRAGNLPRSSHH